MQFIFSLFILIGFSFTLPCFAFDISPEYQGLNEADLEKFETPSDINSEYQTIWNAYLSPLSWSQTWAENPREFNFSLGSLSNNYFLLYSQAKFETELSESLKFRFTYLNQRDLEIDQTRHVIELVQKMTSQFQFALYGEPSLYKRENDIGVAILYSPFQQFQNRFYYTWHDLTRNDHNNQTDYYKSGHHPNSVGWVANLSQDSVWLQMGFRYDQKAEWVRPQESRIFRYWKKLVYADFKRTLSTERALAIRAQWDVTFKEQSPDAPASTVIEESWRLQRAWMRSSYLLGVDDDFVSYEAALTFMARRWTNENDYSVDNFNTLPSLTARIRTLRRGEYFDHVQLGAELTSYQKKDPDHLTSGTQKQDPIEARLQTGYEFSFKNKATLSLGLNFDLDDWVKVPTFEGGSGQLRTEF